MVVIQQCDVEDGTRGMVAERTPDYGHETGPNVSVVLLGYRSPDKEQKLTVRVQLTLGGESRLIGDTPQSIFPAATKTIGFIQIREYEPQHAFLVRALSEAFMWLRSHVAVVEVDGEYAMVVSEDEFFELGVTHPDISGRLL